MPTTLTAACRNISGVFQTRNLGTFLKRIPTNTSLMISRRRALLGVTTQSPMKRDTVHSRHSICSTPTSRIPMSRYRVAYQIDQTFPTYLLKPVDRFSNWRKDL